MFIDAPTDSIQVTTGVARPESSLLEGLNSYPTANIGDALGRLNIMGSAIQSQWKGARCVGVARTVLTREGDNLAIHLALDDVLPGDVLVVNGRGDASRALFGDILAEICLAKQVAGVVIDGTIRDREAIAELGLPVWATGVTPCGPTKTGPGIIGEPVACGGVVVAPGDVIVADGDGVAVISPERLEGMVEKLIAIDQMENRLRVRIQQSLAQEATV